MQDFSCPSSNIVADGSVHMHGSHTYPDDEIEEQRQRDSRQSAIRHPMLDRYIPDPGPSNDKLGVSKKGLPPLDLPPGLIRTVLSSREPPRAQISTIRKRVQHTNTSSTSGGSTTSLFCRDLGARWLTRGEDRSDMRSDEAWRQIQWGEPLF